jgi:hypothetical protein
MAGFFFFFSSKCLELHDNVDEIPTRVLHNRFLIYFSRIIDVSGLVCINRSLKMDTSPTMAGLFFFFSSKYLELHDNVDGIPTRVLHNRFLTYFSRIVERFVLHVALLVQDFLVFFVSLNYLLLLLLLLLLFLFFS